MVKTKEIGRNSPRKPLRSGPIIKSTRRSLLTAKATGSQANIRVVVRIRPPSFRESADNFKTVVKPVNNQLLIFDPQECTEAFFYRGVQQKGRDLLKRPNKNMQFSFDRVFNDGNDNEEVFKDSTQGLIKSLMDGCNCSVFVYGATGAGKTYTMLGAAPEHPGLTFLTMDELFKAKAHLENERKFELHVSYLEVYNESVQDLLANNTTSSGGGSTTSLQVQDSKFGVIVAGLTIRKITDSEELFDLLDRGNRNRTQHPTDANAESSRSHAVFQVYLQMDIIATGQRRLAKLSMIDLAGSERGAATGCKGARFTEGANINKSLLALGNCINALADGLRHVPYRDSKLTRLLKDSLGGNCHTVMIANISPSSLCYEDTYNTLKYANRAKKIKANVQKNVGVGDLHVTQYAKLLEERNTENERLKVENEKLKLENEELKLKTFTSAIVVPKLNIDGSGDAEFDVDIEELRAFWADLCSLEERKRRLELNKRMLVSRLEFLEAETNRSGLYPNSSPDQTKANAKCNRSQKQIGTLTKELNGLEENISAARTQVKTFLASKPYVKIEYDKLLEQFVILKKDLEIAEYHAMNKLLSDQMVRLAAQLDRATKLLKPCFWITKKHGYVTPDLDSEYELLTAAPHSVTWRPSPLFDIQNLPGLDIDGIDSGISSTTTLTNPPSMTQLDSAEESSTPEHSFRSPKRKHANQPNVDLDCTFTLGGTFRVASTPQNIKQQQQQQQPGSNKRIQYNNNNNAGSLTSLSSLTSSSKVKMPIIAVYTSPVAKRLARGALMPSRLSPRLNQPRSNNYGCVVGEKVMNNVKRMAAQPHHGTMGTAPRFASATTATANRANRKPLAITQRTDK